MCIGNGLQRISQPVPVEIFTVCLLVFRVDRAAEFGLFRPLLRINIRNGGDQPFRVNMLGILEYIGRCALFDKASFVHNADTVAHMADNAQIVADK